MYTVERKLEDGRVHRMYYKDEQQYLDYLEDVRKYEQSEEYKELERSIWYGKIK